MRSEKSCIICCGWQVYCRLAPSYWTYFISFHFLGFFSSASSHLVLLKCFPSSLFLFHSPGIAQKTDRNILPGFAAPLFWRWGDGGLAVGPAIVLAVDLPLDLRVEGWRSEKHEEMSEAKVLVTLSAELETFLTWTWFFPSFFHYTDWCWAKAEHVQRRVPVWIVCTQR